MSSVENLARSVPAGGPRPSSLTRIAALHWPALLTVFAAALLRLASGPWFGADVSWLLTLGETLAAGTAPYSKFIEVNPPASILLYLPAVLIANQLDMMTEIVLNALIFCGAIVSVAATVSILGRTGLLSPNKLRWFAVVALFVLLIAPADEFGQREHIAVIAILPVLAVYAEGSGCPPLNSSLLGCNDDGEGCTGD